MVITQIKTGKLGFFIFLSAMSGLMMIGSCKHEPLVPNVPGGDDDGGGGDNPGTGIPCDPSTVYFNQQVLPILVSSCAKSGCHDAASAQEGVILNSYANVMITGEVTPFDLGNSEIWEVITETDPDKQMPPPGENPLTAEQMNLIALWINQGAQNLSCDDNLGPCDSTAVSFNTTVKPIIQNKCVGCHTTATTANMNVNLSTYAGVAAIAANGRLTGVIKHASGYVPMPKNGPKLNACEIGKISNWVAEGYQNN